MSNDRRPEIESQAIKDYLVKVFQEYAALAREAASIDLSPAVEALRQKYGSLSAASREKNIPMSTLQSLRRQTREPGLRTLLILSDALETTPDGVLRIVMEANQEAQRKQVKPKQKGAHGARRRKGER